MGHGHRLNGSTSGFSPIKAHTYFRAPYLKYAIRGKNIHFPARHTQCHKSGGVLCSFHEPMANLIYSCFNRRLNQGETMKRWFLLLPILSCSCFATANGDLAGSEFSVLDRLARGHDMVAMTGQQGNSNIAMINQSGSRSIGAITQSGGNNSALLNQSGFNHRAALAQYGNGNNATVSQSGTQNSVYLVQAGTGNDADITQSGFDNTAVVIARGKNNYTQINQTGTNRSAGVVQNSAGMAIRITQN